MLKWNIPVIIVFLVTTSFVQEDEPLFDPDCHIQFENFGLEIKNFKGYYFDDNSGFLDTTLYDENWKSKIKSVFIQSDSITFETLVFSGDTLSLSESLDDRINKTLFRIIPNNPRDRFRVSQCYIGKINEWVNWSELTEEEQASMENYAFFSQSVNTPWIEIKDSARYYFRTLAHTADMVPVTVVDGDAVLQTGTTEEEQETEQNDYIRHLQEVKDKFGYRDTLVEQDGETYTYANLTRDGKLYNYDYESYFFKLERLRGKKVLETKYLCIYISYGC